MWHAYMWVKKHLELSCTCMSVHFYYSVFLFPSPTLLYGKGFFLDKDCYIFLGLNPAALSSLPGTQEVLKYFTMIILLFIELILSLVLVFFKVLINVKLWTDMTVSYMVWSVDLYIYFLKPSNVEFWDKSKCFRIGISWSDFNKNNAQYSFF